MMVFLIISLLIAIALAAGVVWYAVQLIRRRHHPLQILAQALTAVFFLGVLGLISVIPPGLWFLWWVLVVGLGVSVVIASVRAAREPTAEFETRRPSIVELVVAIVLAVGVVVVGLVSG